jgi:ParB family transcriptional regulator, chromosome partitioning protein
VLLCLTKQFTQMVSRADEGTLSRLMVETSILIAASRGNPSAVLRDAVTAYKVDAEAISAKIKQESLQKRRRKGCAACNQNH